MTKKKNTQKIRDYVAEMEQAADIAKAAVQAEAQVTDALRSSVASLHEWARQAKQSLQGDGEDAAGGQGEKAGLGVDKGTLRGLIAAAEEAADQALEDAKADRGVGKATRAAIKEAHDAAKRAKDLF